MFPCTLLRGLEMAKKKPIAKPKNKLLTEGTRPAKKIKKKGK